MEKEPHFREKELEEQIREIWEGDQGINLAQDDLQPANFIPQRLQTWEKQLDNILTSIFPEESALLTGFGDQEKELLKFGIYHSILSYGSKERKIGKRNYFHHPLEAARELVHSFEEAGERRDEFYLTAILTALYHDVIEEPVTEKLKEEKAKIRTKVWREHPQKYLIQQFVEAGQRLRPHDKKLMIPNDAGSLAVYKKAYLKLAAPKKSKSRKKPKPSLLQQTLGEEFSSKRVDDYFRALDTYVPALERAIDEREKPLLRQEHVDFITAFNQGLKQLGLQERYHELFRNMAYAVGKLTREGSELYYKSLAKLFLNDYGKEIDLQERDEIALLVKLADRIANTKDVGKIEPYPKIKYFSLDSPEAPPYLGLGEMLRKDPKTAHQTIRKLLRHKKDLHLHLGIHDIMEIPPDLAKRDQEVKSLDKALTEILDENNRAHQQEDQGNKSKERMSADDRAYNIFKNFPLFNYLRSYYARKSMPPDMAHLLHKLKLASSVQENLLLERIFTNHTTGGRFNLTNVRHLQQSLREYDAQGGFEKITEKAPEEARSIDQPGYFDGLMHIFDARVRGDESNLKQIFQTKRDLFATIFALHHLTGKYLKFPKYFIEGMDYRSAVLQPAPAVIKSRIEGESR